MIKINKVLNININDITNDINVFEKQNKANNNLGRLEIKRNKCCFHKRTITKYENTYTISLDKYIFICVLQDNKWKLFRYNFSHKINKCICINNLNLLIIQKNNKIVIKEFKKIDKNNPINDIKLLRRHSFVISIYFFYVYNDHIYIVEKLGKLMELNIKEALNPSSSFKEIKDFDLKKNDEIYFKIENNIILIIAYCDNKKEDINIIIYNLKSRKTKYIEISMSYFNKKEDVKRNIEYITLNNNYIVVLFNSNDFIILKKNNDTNNYEIYKYLDKYKSSQLKYFNNKSLKEVECYSSEYIKKINKISSIYLNEDNNLFLIYSDIFLPDLYINKNKFKYFSFVQSTGNILNSYCKKLTKILFSKFHKKEKFNNNSLLYDVNEQLIERTNINMCTLNILDEQISTLDINYNDEIYYLYNNTINILKERLTEINDKQKNQEIQLEEVLHIPVRLDIYEINQNKIKILNNEMNDNISEKGFLNMDFLKDITKNKKIIDDDNICNNIYLCEIDKHFLILENQLDDFNLTLYEVNFLNKIELLIYQFFNNYYDSILLAERKHFSLVHQFFVYSIYDYSGRYFDSPLIDYQCLFKIKNIFHFLERAVKYDPFTFRNEDDEQINELLNIKNNSYNKYENILTNLNIDEENSNYHNLFYILNENYTSSSRYVNNYYSVKKIDTTPLYKNIDINIHLYKLENVLYSSLKRINYILEEENQLTDLLSSDESEDDEENTIIKLTKNKLKKNIETKRNIKKEYENEDDSNDEKEDDESCIRKIWGLSINEEELDEYDSSLDSTEKKKNEKEETKYKCYDFHDINLNKSYDYSTNIKEDEILKKKLMNYKKEIMNQIYKYKLYRYIMKLLDKERSSSSSSSHYSKFDEEYKKLNVVKYSNKNKFSDIFNIFKKNTNDSTNINEGKSDNKICSNNNNNNDNSKDLNSSNVYIINWTKFKYYYSPFDILKYFLINQNYFLIKIFYKYFNTFINYNWQKIYYYIPINTNIEDFFFLLPIIKKTESYTDVDEFNDNNKNTIYNKEIQYSIIKSSKNINYILKNGYSNNLERSSNEKEKEYSLFSYKNSDMLYIENYDIMCNECVFFEFFINRSINIIKKTHLIKSRLLAFVYICLKHINDNNVYKIYKYDSELKKYTFNEKYFLVSDNNILNKNKNYCNTFTEDYDEKRKNSEGENIDMNEENNVTKFNFNDTMFIKNNLYVNLKKDKIPNKNVILMYSLFILIKMYIVCKENNKNVKFDEFLEMDIYDRLCLILDFDIKYLSNDYDQENYVKNFYDKFEDILKNYKYIDEHIITTNENYIIFDKDLVNLNYKKANNFLECLYINILYSSQQLFIIFCLKTLKILQSKSFCYGYQKSNKSISSLLSENLYGDKKKKKIQKKAAELDKVLIFLKNIYFIYKNKIIFNHDYEYSFFFLIIFYKHMKINLLYFITIFNDFYLLLPKKIKIDKEQSLLDRIHMKNYLCSNKNISDSKEDTNLFNLIDIFKTSDNYSSSVIFDEYLDHIVIYYYDAIKKKSVELQKNFEQEEKLDYCKLLERYLDMFEKHLNALEIVKHFKKDFINQEDELKINIDIILNSKNNLKKSILNIYKLFKIIILNTKYKDNNFTKNCLQLYYNLFLSVDLYLFFLIIFYIILFYSNDFEYLYSFMKFYKEYKHLDIKEYSYIINYLIINRVKSITIYDKFIELYNFLRKVYSLENIFNLKKNDEILTNLRILYYIQNFINKNKYVILPEDMNTQKKISESNEDIYKSFSKLIAQTYEKNSKNRIKKNYVNDKFSIFYNNIFYDSYIKVKMETNKFKIFKNIVENNLNVCCNYRKTINLIKLLNINNEVLCDTILYIIYILQIKKETKMLQFYLILFIILFQDKKLNKKYKLFLENVIIYYSKFSEQSINYIYNFSMFFFSHLSLNYSLYLNTIYKLFLKKKQFLTKRIKKNYEIYQLHNFTSLYHFLSKQLDETKIKENKYFDDKIEKGLHQNKIFDLFNKKNNIQNNKKNQYSQNILSNTTDKIIKENTDHFIHSNCKNEQVRTYSDNKENNVMKNFDENIMEVEKDTFKKQKLENYFGLINHNEIKENDMHRSEFNLNNEINNNHIVDNKYENNNNNNEKVEYLNEIQVSRNISADYEEINSEKFEAEIESDDKNNENNFGYINENDIDEDDYEENYFDENILVEYDINENDTEESNTDENNNETTTFDDSCSSENYSDLNNFIKNDMNYEENKLNDEYEIDINENINEKNKFDEGSSENFYYYNEKNKCVRNEEEIALNCEKNNESYVYYGNNRNKKNKINYKENSINDEGKNSEKGFINNLNKENFNIFYTCKGNNKFLNDKREHYDLIYFHIKKINNEINKYNVRKWDTDNIFKTVNKIKHMFKKKEEFKEKDNLFLHSFNLKNNFKKEYTNKKNYIYHSLINNDIYFAFIYILSVEDYSFVYTFIRNVILNNFILINRKIEIIDITLLSIYNFHIMSKQKYNISENNKNKNTFLQKIVCLLIIMRYLLFSLHIKRIDKVNIKKLFFEDNYKKNIVENLDKKSCDEILEILIKTADISKVNLLEINYELIKKKNYLIYNIGVFEDNKDLLSNFNIFKNNAFNEETKKEKRFQYLFEIETEKEILNQFQKNEKNSLFHYILTNFKYLNFNINFVYKILYYIYETCLYNICSSIYFIKVSFYNFNLGNIFSSVSKIIKKLPQCEIINKLIELRYVFIYLNEMQMTRLENQTREKVKENENKNDTNNYKNESSSNNKIMDKVSNTHKNNISFECCCEISKDNLFDTMLIIYNTKILNNFNFQTNQIKNIYSSSDEKDIEFLKNSNIEIYKLSKKNIYDYYIFLFKKLNIKPYIYDLCFLLRNLNIFFHSFFYLSEKNYDNVNELFDPSEDDYLKFLLLILLKKNFSLFEKIKNIENNVYRYFYSNKKYHDIFMKFFMFHILLKLKNENNDSLKIFNILNTQFIDIKYNIELDFNKLVIIGKKKMNKFLNFYKFMDKFNIYYSEEFLKLIIDNIYRIDILFVLLLYKKNKKIIEYIIYKILIVLFFTQFSKYQNISVNTFFHFVFSNIRKSHLERYPFLDKIFNEENYLLKENNNYIDNYDKNCNINIKRNLSIMKSEPDTYNDIDKQFTINKDVHIDKNMITDDDIDINKTNKNEIINIEEHSDININKNFSLENTNIVDINKNMNIDEINSIHISNDIYNDKDAIIKHNSIDEQFNAFEGEKSGNEKKENFFEINEENCKLIINFCQNYLSQEKIIRNIIKNELNSLVFLKFSYNVKVLSMYEKSKHIYNYLHNLKKCNIFFSIKILVKMFLKTKMKQRNYNIYHFFIIIHIIYYIKKNLFVRKKDGKIDKEYMDFYFKNDAEINEEFYRNKNINNDSEINHFNDDTYNLDNTITNKLYIIKSLIILLLIKLTNIFLPSINKIYFNKTKDYIFIDCNDEIKLNYNISDFIFLILNFINMIYAKGYEFIYISLLFLMEYCIELICDNNDIKHINISNILVINKTENLINEYKKNYDLLDDKNNILNFITKENYDKIKSMLSSIYLKILKNCDNSILLACKIMIGNRLNLEDEMDLFKVIKNDFLFFFTYNSSILKSNKQNILLQNNLKKLVKEKNDFFHTKISTFIKILLIIMTYNINSFKDSEYYQTIKQIINDNQWFSIFSGYFVNETNELSFLCKNKKKDNDCSSDSSCSIELSETLKFDSLNITKNKSETSKRDKNSDEENYKNVHKENFNDQFKSLYLLSSNETKSPNEIFNKSRNNNIFSPCQNEIEKFEKLYDENDNSENKERKIEFNKRFNDNLFKSNNENFYINEELSEKKSSVFKENDNEVSNEEDEFFKYNISKTQNDILNEYGEGFLSFYINKLNNNENCDKYFNTIYKKSKMINLMEYCKYILKYWRIEMENDKKSEGIQILIFFANYFNFFQNFIKYKIILKLYINNNLHEADEILGNKSMWNWYRNDTKIKSNIENYLTKDISFNNFFDNIGSDKFLKNLSKFRHKNNFEVKNFYLTNFRNNKYNKKYLRSLYMQYYTFTKFIKKNNGEDIAEFNINNNKKENDYFNNMNDLHKEQNNSNEQGYDCNVFPLFFLSFLEIYKNTIDVYDFYYQSIIFKLINNHELNINKIQLLYQDLQKYFQNKLSNYDLYLMLFYYQYFSFQSIYNSNTNINFLNKSEQKLILYIWIKYTKSLLKEYRC
ncbi:conserved Plasmodium protein, unknown function [Plasmodium gallinaceum]|uniref:Uncharacterized protein n=1 Tax=Plasmodium gallinaceum TaxID=5849 RepID=A0A1J1GPR1_PLAGA|nr:conserved Plasmodium protein, unknown function [Plasmodium gallinaceum]CRG93279.1 conserved Plasmodium protein, unknown function [Plasmodium gallinaceum]